MSKIAVTVTGNGEAHCSNYNPPNATTFVLYANAFDEDYIIDITARSREHGYAVAMSTTSEQTITYNDDWGGLDIDVVFSGSTPPPPPPGSSKSWLSLILGKNNIERRNNRI